MRIACLLIPDLPLCAELRAHPELAGAALALASGTRSQSEIVAVSREALAAGVHPPCSVAHARSICSEISLRVASPALERATRETLRDLALAFSPRVALAPRPSGLFACEGAVFLDASGVASVFRSEAGFAGSLAARAEALGLPGVVAIASSRSVAQIAARQLALPSTAGYQGASHDGECLILEPDEEIQKLAPLPIDLLNPSDELSETLGRFGVRLVRDLLRLPRRALAQRLGPDILHLIDRARGRGIEPPLPEPRDTSFREAIDLEYEIDQLEPLAFVLRGLLSRLAERLTLRGLACGPIDLGFELAGGGRNHRRIVLAAPTRDVRVLLRLVTQALESDPPAAPVQCVVVATEALPVRNDQLDLFRPAGPDPNSLDHTLTELESLCGAGRVGAPAVADDHRPQAYDLEPFTGVNLIRDAENEMTCATNDAWGKKTAQPSSRDDADRVRFASPFVVRALRPPVRAEVHVDRGLPSTIRSAVASGRILNAAGPWRVTGHWWSEEGRYAIDHFDVQVSDGSILRLCFDWVRRDWQVDGIYD